MTAAAVRVVEVERRIAASPEIVFSYFVDPGRYVLWQGVDAELDPRPGGTFRVRMTGKTAMVVRGVFEEIDPPTRLVFSWGWEQHADGAPEGIAGVMPGTSTVEVDLRPDGDHTVLRLRHRGLPGDGARQFHSSGWAWYLDRLAVVASGGDPGPNPYATL